MTKAILENTVGKKNMTRESYGIMSGVTGIVLNVLLCIVKFVTGSLSGSVSITADAINNLSDAASNIVTIFGTKLANKPVDKDHPFGHGRIEYISALVISVLIFLMSYELGKSSVRKIIHPESVKFSFVYVAVLLIAIAVKLWMAYFNNVLYKITDNINMKAVKQDSLNDSISTFATLIAMIIIRVTGFVRIDGIVGLAVAVFILMSGVGILKDIIGPLLGQAPPAELVENIEETMMAQELIVGVHDLIVHNYGPGRIIASAHAEVPSDVDIVEAHDVIDNVEKEIMKKYNIIICIHMDPIVINDEEVSRYREMTAEIIKNYNAEFSFHDFKMVKGPTHTNLIFDLEIPYADDKSKSKIYSDLLKLFRMKDPCIELVIQIEHAFV